MFIENGTNGMTRLSYQTSDWLTDNIIEKNSLSDFFSLRIAFSTENIIKAYCTVNLAADNFSTSHCCDTIGALQCENKQVQ